MFTVGIFTTHFPYIAFVVFYAYFLIFGVEKASNDDFTLAGHSIQIEQHINDFQATAVPAFDFFSLHATEGLEHAVCSCQQAKQKWKLCHRHTLHVQEYILESPFCRPPPALA